MNIKRKGFVILLGIMIIILLSSCFKRIPVSSLNTDEVSVTLASNYNFYSNVNASAIEIVINKKIPEDAFLYDKDNSIAIIKPMDNKTIVLFSKAQRDITKGEKLFTLKRKYLNLETDKLETEAAFYDEKSKRVITKASDPFEDGISVTDNLAIKSGDPATVAIHMKGVSDTLALEFDVMLPSNNIVKFDDTTNATVEYIGSESAPQMIVKEIPNGLRISLVKTDGMNFEDEDVLELKLVGQGDSPKTPGQITITNLSAKDLNNADISYSVYAGDIVVYNPVLLGDFDNEDTSNDERDNKVDLNDFLIFVKHYGTQQGDTLYSTQCDIYPAEIAPVKDWVDENIYSVAFKDGKIGIEDFIIFARNYKKSVPVENSIPEFPSDADSNVTPSDEAQNVNIGTENVTFPDASDENGDELKYTVYIGVDKNNLKSDTSSSTTVNILKILGVDKLDRGRTYYWRVKVSDGKGGEDWIPSKDDFYEFTTSGLDTLFVAGGYEGIFVIDISDTSASTPATVANSVNTEGYVYNLSKFEFDSKEYIAVSDGNNGVAVYEYTPSSSALTKKTDSYYFGSTAYDVLETTVTSPSTKAYILVAASTEGLQILHFDNSAGELSYVSSILGSSDVRGLYQSGDYVYVAANDGLHIVDISNINSPTEIGSYEISGALNVYVDGNYAYVAAGSGGVYKIDISDPANPSEVANASMEAYDVSYKDGYVYIAAGTNGVIKLDGNTLSEDSKYDSGIYYVGNILIDGGTLFAGNKRYGLLILNIDTMEKINTLDNGAVAKATKTLENYIIVADSENGVNILDATTLSFTTAKSTASIQLDGIAKSVEATQLTNIFVSKGSYGVDVLKFDTSNGNLTKLKSLPILGEAYNVTIVSTVVYVSSGSGGLNVYENSGNYDFVNRVQLSGKIVTDSATTDDNRLIVSTTDSIEIYDISNLGAPTTSSDYSGYNLSNGSIFDIETATIGATKTYIYAAAGSEGVIILKYEGDTSSATLTKLGSSRFDDAFITDITLDGTDTLILSAGNKGVIIMKVSDPTELGDADARNIGASNDSDSDGNYVENSYDTQGNTTFVEKVNDGTNDHYVVSDGENGLVILDSNLDLEKDYNWLNFEGLAAN
ncbi:LVIVD repeat protein [Marinitoga piezophila KA3]|uniref:LVIVD repeat protein n=1 Tax=Marinitoga piezophila (strain DSM 14283 / JCM 11233 / KA3) TaxID=443254 RepID=H2J7S7_MARPK|nr:LVIVD repeat-containing protein [Marinitoga piezophila]AEX85418.1 LVIVD repeat protein [Marinitoga piezophila KA3]